jgi:hypothetical protein
MNCHLCSSFLVPDRDEDGNVIIFSYSCENDAYGYDSSDWYRQSYECPSNAHRVTLWFEDNPPSDFGFGAMPDHWEYHDFNGDEHIASYDYKTNAKLTIATWEEADR